MGRFLYSFTLLIVSSLGGLFFSEKAFSLWQPLKQVRKILGKNFSQESFIISPLDEDQFFERVRDPQAFSLYREGSLDFRDMVQEFLKEQVSSPLLEIRAKEAMSYSLTQGGQESLIFNLYFDDIEVCDLEVKAQKIAGQDIPVILGSLPDFDDVLTVSAVDWPVRENAWDALKSLLLEQQPSLFSSPHSLKLIRFKKCFWPENHTFYPAWKFTYNIDGLAFEAIGDEESTFKQMELFFDLEVKGQVQAYETNPNQSDLKVFDTEFSGDKTLTNEFFKTDPQNSQGTGSTQRATSETHSFIYNPTEINFSEASTFIHATQMYEYFKTLGYSWAGGKPLLLKLHSLVNNNKNNALFQPAEGNQEGLPSILLGDGDGKILKNLPIDSDVVSHEFSHHVVFRTLKETRNESLVLHEGLADFFAFSLTGDPCLGESICPDGSKACVVPATCLRTADNKITFNSSEYEKLEPHQKGQLVSGFLWDLRKVIGAEITTKMTYQAVDFFVRNSGFNHFINSLMLADQNLTGGKNSCSIFDAAVKRGFSIFLQEIDCHNLSTLEKPTESVSQEATKEDSSKNKKKGIFGCGVIALSQDQASHALNVMLFLLFLLPLLFARINLKRK